MRVLVGYDGSECADAAIEDLRRAGLPRRGEAMVVTVAEEWPAFMLAGYDALEMERQSKEDVARGTAVHSVQMDRWAAAASETAKSGAERLRAILPGWQVTPSVHSSSPYSALLRVADEWKADLLVIGSHGRSAVGRILFGSVSHFAVNHARCSIRIARTPLFTSEAPARLLLGLDGSEDSLIAVEEVARRTWPKGTEVRIITALDYRFLALAPVNDFPMPHYDEPLDTELRHSIELAAARACARLGSAGIVTQSFVRDADPIHALLDEADNWHADAIFLGARGHSAFERFLVGSVSAGVALHARCSVEIVRPRVEREQQH
jgi:nucleotide-binding universal stress UspA family protein